MQKRKRIKAILFLFVVISAILGGMPAQVINNLNALRFKFKLEVCARMTGIGMSSIIFGNTKVC